MSRVFGTAKRSLTTLNKMVYIVEVRGHCGDIKMDASRRLRWPGGQLSEQEANGHPKGDSS